MVQALVCCILVCPFALDISLTSQTVGAPEPTVFFFVLSCLTVEERLPRSFFVSWGRRLRWEMSEKVLAVGVMSLEGQMSVAGSH